MQCQWGEIIFPLYLRTLFNWEILTAALQWDLNALRMGEKKWGINSQWEISQGCPPTERVRDTDLGKWQEQKSVKVGTFGKQGHKISFEQAKHAASHPVERAWWDWWNRRIKNTLWNEEARVFKIVPPGRFRWDKQGPLPADQLKD